jgi:hypothetical protein
MFPLSRFARLFLAAALVLANVLALVFGDLAVARGHPAPVLLLYLFVMTAWAVLMLGSLRPSYRRRVRRGVAAATGVAGLVAMSACGTIPGGSGGVSAAGLTQILTDPRCEHTDEFEGITGAAGIPASLHFKAARHCPAAEPQVYPLKDIAKIGPDAPSVVAPELTPTKP